MLGVEQSLLDALAKLLFAPRESGDAAFARAPVAGGHIEQDHLGPGSFGPGCYLFRRVLIGEQKLDRRETCPRCGLEAVKERNLVEHH